MDLNPIKRVTYAWTQEKNEPLTVLGMQYKYCSRCCAHARIAVGKNFVANVADHTLSY